MLIQSMNFTMDVSGQFAILLVASAILAGSGPAHGQVRLRVGWCARTVTATPFAIATRMGGFKEKVDSRDLLTNEHIDEIHRFDAARIAAEARAWKR